MRIATLLWKSAWYHRRAHLGATLGALVAAAVLTGARLTGDSVRFSLRQLTERRLGTIDAAMTSGTRFFPADLADRLTHALQTNVCAVMTVPAVALHARPDGTWQQVGAVQALGVDERFWRFAAGRPPALGADEVALNDKLAAALGAAPGDRIDLRLQRPGLLPADAPLSSRAEDGYQRASFRVAAIVPADALGHFSLHADQRVPHNAFLALPVLQNALARPGQANGLLAAPHRQGEAGLAAAMRAVWQLRDAGAVIREIAADLAPTHVSAPLQVGSERIFLDRALTAALAADTNTADRVGALTYLVDTITAGTGTLSRFTPYSFVTALSPTADPSLGLVPAGMRDDEIIVNRWLADTLALTPGDVVTLAYRRIEPAGRYAQAARTFRVHSVAPMNAMARERDRMPAFPGLSEVESCADWDIGMPMDAALLNNKDNEAYWNTYRATPKALVTLAAGQAMWGNAFGDLMTVRFPRAAGDAATLAASLTAAVEPAALGFALRPVRAQAQQSLAGATDFGGLFLGMSLFLIVAALLLTALLFTFGMQQRAKPIGTLLAFGFTRRRLLALCLAESSGMALLGVVAGAALGTVYTRALIAGLQGPWRPAVMGVPIAYHAAPGTLISSAAMAFVCAILAMLLALRSLMREPVVTLLQADFSQTPAAPARRRAWLPAAALLAAAAVIAWAGGRPDRDPAGPFFLAGALLLAGYLGLVRSALACARVRAEPRLTWRRLGLTNAARRRGRSLAVVALFACGAFLVFAVAAMRVDPGAGAASATGPAGGYGLIADATLPVPDRLEELPRLRGPARQQAAAIAAMHPVSIRVRAGDAAGCLNLQAPQQPRLLGVPVDALQQRGAFAATTAAAALWAPLTEAPPDGVVPALAGDRDTLLWSLRKSTHGPNRDLLTAIDGNGRPFTLKLVGALPHRMTVFHGSVLIADRHFREHFPGESGYRLWLLDALPEQQADAAQAVAELLRAYGPDVVPATARLAEFHAVEQVYLAMFLALGGLGLLLGSVGLGVVVLRNVLERRGELAALTAIGYRRTDLRRLLWLEHGMLLALGLGGGTLAAAAAVAPALLSPHAGVPWRDIGLACAGVFGAGLLWTWIAACAATRGDLRATLREE